MVVYPVLIDGVHAVRAAFRLALVAVMETWQAVHSIITPAWPWRAMLRRLSLACELGNSACVEPWQAEHCRPPWPMEKR